MATGQLSVRQGKRLKEKDKEREKETRKGRKAEPAKVASEKVSAHRQRSVTKHRILCVSHTHTHTAMFCQVDQKQLEFAVGVLSGL